MKVNRPGVRRKQKAGVSDERTKEVSRGETGLTSFSEERRHAVDFGLRGSM